MHNKTDKSQKIDKLSYKIFYGKAIHLTKEYEI